MTDEDFIDRFDLPPAPKKKDNHPSRNRHYYNKFPFDRVKRWLRSYVGKNFNTVYSEYHKLDWIDPDDKNMKALEYILSDVFLENDVVMLRGWRSSMPMKNEMFQSHLYIHPKTNILSFKPRNKRLTYEQSEAIRIKDTHRILGDFHQLVKMEGIWYEVFLKESHEEYKGRDKETGKELYKTVKHTPKVPYEPMVYNRWNYRNPREIKTRRQLSSKELRKHNIRND